MDQVQRPTVPQRSVRDGHGSGQSHHLLVELDEWCVDAENQVAVRVQLELGGPRVIAELRRARGPGTLRLRFAMSAVFCCSRLGQRLLPVFALLAAHCGSNSSPPQMAGVSGSAGAGVASGGEDAGNSGNVGGTSSTSSAGKGNNSFGGAITAVPGTPGCGLGDKAAFCDSFDDIAADNGRAGELDVHKWSGAR